MPHGTTDDRTQAPAEPDHDPRPRRARLSLPRLVAGALDVARELGADHMTMKDVASHLDVGTMSLYYHVPDKAALLAHMVGELFAGVGLPPPDEHWEDRLRSVLTQVYDGFAGVPGLEPHAQWADAAVPNVARVNDAVLVALADGGLPRPDAVRAALVLLGYAANHGAATARRQRVSRTDPPRRAETVAGVASTGHDAVRESLAEAAGLPHEEIFEYGLGVLFQGLRARSPMSGP